MGISQIGDTGPRSPGRLLYTDRAVVRETKTKSSTACGFEGVGQNLQEDFPYMGSLPIHGKTSHAWEVFPYMLKTSHVWEDFPNMGSLIMYGKTSQTSEDFPCLGRLPRYGNVVKTFNIWEVCPCMGSLPTCGKFTHTWEVFSHTEVFPHTEVLP
jgi:hypothetical protein